MAVFAIYLSYFCIIRLQLFCMASHRMYCNKVCNNLKLKNLKYKSGLESQ